MKRLLFLLLLVSQIAYGQEVLTYSGKAFTYGSTVVIYDYWLTRYPSELAPTIYSNTQINLTWTNNGETDYSGVSIERSTDGVTYAEIDTISAGETNYSDTTCIEATLYYYRIRYYTE